jgi:hypothetical protein
VSDIFIIRDCWEVASGKLLLRSFFFPCYLLFVLFFLFLHAWKVLIWGTYERKALYTLKL